MYCLKFVSIFALNLLILQIQCSNVPHREEHANKVGITNPVIRVMTFNLFNSGIHVKDGMQKIVNHILAVNPDIVALEEVESTEVLTNITKMLGSQWSGKCNDQGYPDMAVVTRHKMMTTNDSTANHLWENGAMRSKIMIIASGGSQIIVNFWALHLAYETYGPYVACNKAVTDPIQIEAAEAYVGGSSPGRIQNAHVIVSDPYFQTDLAYSDQEPLFVLGDMNSPSHLDWTSNTKDAHCGWEFAWPATKILHLAGLSDAYRQVYPDPSSMPGNTWSPIQKWNSGWQGMIPEPQDRIDMIHYRSSQWTPVFAQVYTGDQPLVPEPYERMNDWPSDHASVYADFQLNQ